MNAVKPRLLVSLHDVSPAHLQRLQKAEKLLCASGVTAAQYLFVPQFHGLYRASEHPGFLDWLRRERTFAVSWCLHGFCHLDGPTGEKAAVVLTLADCLKRRFLTGGEGEFLALGAVEQRRRLMAGLEEFALCFHGARPAGFVAPAWLFKPEVLLPLLRELGFLYTEDHHRIYDVNRGVSIPAPVITWATRTFMRKYGSLVLSPLRARWFRHAPVVRLALHPHDFDHPATVRNIEGVLRSLMRDREIALPERLEWGSGR
jgi:predicted deacetylase